MMINNMMPNLNHRAVPAQTIKTDLQPALRAWEKKTPPPTGGVPVGLDVKRVHLGRRKGFAVRIVHGERGRGGPIVAEWKRPTDDDARDCYLLVMQALASLKGFGGIVASSNDTDAPLELDGADWSALT